MCANVYICPDGDTTTTPPDLSRPELWIAVSLLLFIVTISVCGLVLFLRFRRAHCRLKNAEDHDVTMLKVPSGDDPTYGVRDLIRFLTWSYQKMFKFFSLITYWIYLSFSTGNLWWVLYIREWDRAALSGPEDYGQANLTCGMCRSVSFLTTAAFSPCFVYYFTVV